MYISFVGRLGCRWLKRIVVFEWSRVSFLLRSSETFWQVEFSAKKGINLSRLFSADHQGSWKRWQTCKIITTIHYSPSYYRCPYTPSLPQDTIVSKDFIPGPSSPLSLSSWITESTEIFFLTDQCSFLYFIKNDAPSEKHQGLFPS